MPFLKRGNTDATLYMAGKEPRESDSLKMRQRGPASSSAQIFRGRGGSLSDPVDLKGEIFLRSLQTSVVVTGVNFAKLVSCRGPWGICREGGRSGSEMTDPKKLVRLETSALRGVGVVFRPRSLLSSFHWRRGSFRQSENSLTKY